MTKHTILLEIQGTYLVPSTILVGFGALFSGPPWNHVDVCPFSNSWLRMPFARVGGFADFYFHPYQWDDDPCRLFLFFRWVAQPPTSCDLFPPFFPYSWPISLCKKTWAPLFHMFLTDIFPIVFRLWMAMFIHFPDISLIFPLYFPLKTWSFQPRLTGSFL
jgi:hypothetical protein